SEALAGIARACVYDKKARVRKIGAAYGVWAMIEAESRTLGKTKKDAQSYARNDIARGMLCVLRAGAERKLGRVTISYRVKLKTGSVLELERVRMRLKDMQGMKEWRKRPIFFLQDTDIAIHIKKRWRREYNGWHRVRLS